MSRMLKLDTAALALALLFLAASPAAAQIQRLEASRITAEARQRPVALGCCKCLGGTNSLDLSTISSNPWTVNGGSAVFLSSIHPLWNINPGPAAWVSTAANGGTGGTPAGVYEYRLDFIIPACTIGQEVTLTGNVGGDDGFDMFIDNANGPANPTNTQYFLAECNTGWCFNKDRVPLRTFTKTLGTGTHTLIVRVKNSGGPSGMFVNATLTGACRRD